MYLITFAKSLKYTHTLRNGLIFCVVILVSAKLPVIPDFSLDVITSLVLMDEHCWLDITSCKDSDRLNGDNWAIHLNHIPKSFNTVILIFLVLVEHDFLQNLQKKLSSKRCSISFRVNIACIFVHQKSGVTGNFAETRIAK